MRIGIDVGGTKIIAGIVDKDGNVTYKKKIPTEKKRGYSGIIDGIIGLVNDILRENGIAKEKIERIGIASAGQIDKDSKNIIFSPNWRKLSVLNSRKKEGSDMSSPLRKASRRSRSFTDGPRNAVQFLWRHGWTAPAAANAIPANISKPRLPKARRLST